MNRSGLILQPPGPMRCVPYPGSDLNQAVDFLMLRYPFLSLRKLWALIRLSPYHAFPFSFAFRGPRKKPKPRAIFGTTPCASDHRCGLLLSFNPQRGAWKTVKPSLPQACFSCPGRGSFLQPLGTPRDLPFASPRLFPFTELARKRSRRFAGSIASCVRPW